MLSTVLAGGTAVAVDRRSDVFMSPILGPKAQWLVSYGEELHSRGQTDGWKCSAEEDAGMSKHWQGLSTVALADVSIGVLQLSHGLEKSFVEVANSSRACLEETFGASLPLTVARAEDITCRYKQQGTKEEEECFSALMSAKVRAARSSPYDITIMINTDVYGNPSHPMRLGVAEALKKRMVEGGIDLFVANEPSFSVYRGDFTQRMNFGLVNSGMLIFRKSPITDRFFACAEQFMANTPRQRKHSKMHVREAYDNLLMPRGATLLPTLSNAAMSAAGLEVDCKSWCAKGARAQEGSWKHTCGFASCRSCRQCDVLADAAPAEPSMRSVTSRTLPPEWTCRLQPLQPNPMYLQPDAPTDVGDTAVPCIFVHSVRWPAGATPGKCPLSAGAAPKGEEDGGCLSRGNGACGGQAAANAIAAAEAGASEQGEQALQRWQSLQLQREKAAAQVSRSEHQLAKLAEVAHPGAVAISDAELRLKWHLNSDAVAKAEAEAKEATELAAQAEADEAGLFAELSAITARTHGFASLAARQAAKAEAEEALEAKAWALADQRRNHRASLAAATPTALAAAEDAALAEAEAEAVAAEERAASAAAESAAASQAAGSAAAEAAAAARRPIGEEAAAAFRTLILTLTLNPP